MDFLFVHEGIKQLKCTDARLVRPSLDEYCSVKSNYLGRTNRTSVLVKSNSAISLPKNKHKLLLVSGKNF